MSPAFRSGWLGIAQVIDGLTDWPIVGPSVRRSVRPTARPIVFFLAGIEWMA